MKLIQKLKRLIGRDTDPLSDEEVTDKLIDYSMTSYCLMHNIFEHSGEPGQADAIGALYVRLKLNQDEFKKFLLEKIGMDARILEGRLQGTWEDAVNKDGPIVKESRDELGG